MIRVSSRSPLPESATKSKKISKKVHFLKPTKPYAETSTHEYIKRHLGKGDEPDSQHWKELAESFKCDDEALGETNLMNELLDLCSWWGSEDNLFLTTGATCSDSDDDEDAEWVLNFQKHANQLQSGTRTSKATQLSRMPLTSVNDLRLKSLLRLQSTSSFGKFRESSSWISSSENNPSPKLSHTTSRATSGFFSSKITDEMEFAYQGILCSDNVIRKSPQKTHQKPIRTGCPLDDAFEDDIDF
ncbi:unnamed protein product, partial [Mesorhabditis belari]|uniref:Uncharacterized protein n=1 Tax=Mesorhabditis belari TaxID=2138241 RepID=A0AAF3F2J4_9BILA